MEAWGRSRGSEGLVEASGGLEGGLAEAWERLGEAREMGKVRGAWRRLGEAWGMAWQRLGRRGLACNCFRCLQDLWTLEITCEEANASVENECLQLRISFQSWGPGVDFWHEKCRAIL